MLVMVRLAGARDRLGAGSEVLDDPVGAALDGEDVEELEDDVLGRRPAVERAGELDADHLGLENLPVETGHDVHRIGAADAARDHPETAGVGGVRIGAEHHPAGEGVILEHDLVDDAGARLPEAETVARRCRLEEIVDLAVEIDGGLDVGVGAGAGEDEVVAVDRRGHRRGVAAREHELEQRHLGGGVLHGDPVGLELDIGLAALENLVLGVGQVAEEHLLGEGERLVETAADDLEAFRGSCRRPSGRVRGWFRWSACGSSFSREWSGGPVEAGPRIGVVILLFLRGPCIPGRTGSPGLIRSGRHLSARPTGRSYRHSCGPAARCEARIRGPRRAARPGGAPVRHWPETCSVSRSTVAMFIAGNRQSLYCDGAREASRRRSVRPTRASRSTAATAVAES